MELIENVEELKANIDQFEKSLASENGDLVREETLNLIRRGRNFVMYKVEDEYRFAPSRFLGYKKNTIQAHLKSLEKDGKDTTPRISRVLGQKHQPDEELNEMYEDYCGSLGIVPYNHKHTYWLLEGSFESEYNGIDCFSEGRILYRKHRTRERDRRLIIELKRKYRDHLQCCICGFDFEKTYGTVGRGYIEAHHTKPIAQMKRDDKTKLSDMALVCANCHRMIHSKSPDCYSMEEIKNCFCSSKD